MMLPILGLLVIAGMQDVQVSGTVVSSSGLPVANAAVTIRTQAGKNNGPLITTKTDTEGRFTCEAPESEAVFVVEAKKAGMMPGFSRRIQQNHGDLKSLRLELESFRELSGKVVDSQGTALVGVRVFHQGDSTRGDQTTSDDQGRFSLRFVPERTCILFAEKQGYWFRGVAVGSDAGIVTIRLARRSKPNPEEIKVRRWEPAGRLVQGYLRDSVKALIRQTREANVPGLENAAQPSLYALVLAAPETADKLAAEMNWSAGYARSIRTFQISCLAMTDFHEAIAKAKAEPDPEQRIQALVGLADVTDKKEEIRQALVLATEAIPALQANQRLVMSGKLCRALGRKGIAAPAKQLAAQVVKTIEGQPPMLRALAASFIARADPATAKRLLEESPEKMLRALSAAELAEEHSEDAAELLKGLGFREDRSLIHSRWCSLPRTCEGIAHADVGLARKVAAMCASGEPIRASLPTHLKNEDATPVPVNLFHAFNLGLIAGAISESQPEQARDCLTEAIRLLGESHASVVSRHMTTRFITPSLVAAALIPAAAKIDKGLAAELCWRSLSMRFALSPNDDGDSGSLDHGRLYAIQALAMVDHPAARSLMASVAERMTKRSHDGKTMFWLCLDTYRLIDGKQCLNWVRSLPDESSPGTMSPRETARSRWLTNHYADSVFHPDEDNLSRYERELRTAFGLDESFHD